MSERLSIRSRDRNDWLDITKEVARIVRSSGIRAGVATVFVPHTTAGVTLQENADAPLKRDITAALDRLFPWTNHYRHCEDNAAAHMKAMLTGSSVQIPIDQGEMQLGTWQGIYFCDFDGPRDRMATVTITACQGPAQK